MSGLAPAAGMRPFDMSRYRQQGESPHAAPQPPPSSQGDAYAQVPKTHRVMTLADHISVRRTLGLGLCAGGGSSTAGVPQNTVSCGYPGDHFRPLTNMLSSKISNLLSLACQHLRSLSFYLCIFLTNAKLLMM